MGVFSSTVFYDNEIAKTIDFNNGENSVHEALGLLVREVFSPGTNKVIINGLTVRERATPSMNVDVDAGTAFDPVLEQIIYNTDSAGPIAVATAHVSQVRIDIIEMRRSTVPYNTQQRAFRDPLPPNSISYQNVTTQKKYVAEFQTKAGTPGTGIPATVDSGWVKLAEIYVGAGVSTILNINIKNCSGGYDGEVTASWIGETAITYKLGANSTLKTTFRNQHTELGAHNAAGFLLVGIGALALAANTTGIGNMAVGVNALQLNTIGSYNTAIGNLALQKNTNGGNNTAVGESALNANTIGINNTAVGCAALPRNTIGSANIAIGYNTLAANTTGNDNVAVGNSALTANMTGSYNVAIGYHTLYTNTTSSYNVAVGWSALNLNTTGQKNTAIGYNALTANTIGNYNVALGYVALESNTTAIENTAIGAGALQKNTSGVSNTAIGYDALNANINGCNNIAIGAHALSASIQGGSNIAIGNNTLSTYGGLTGNNVAIGHEALKLNLNGTYNVAIGYHALGALTTGEFNTAIGSLTGVITTGRNNTLIGYSATPSLSTINNEITLGNSSITALRCNVTTITALSDERDKADIKDFAVGLSALLDVRTIEYKWDRREWYIDGVRTGEKKSNVVNVGFSAQNLKAVIEKHNLAHLNLVYESNPDKLEITPGNLLPVLVNAIKELNARIVALEKPNS